MKTLFVCLLSFVSTSAFASANLNPSSLPMSVLSHLRSADQGTPSLKPIRQAQIHVAIQHNRVEKLADGSYSISAEVVCNKEAPLDVYDLRGLSDYSLSNSMVSCPAKFKDKDVTVYLTGVIWLQTYSLFEGQAPSDRKCQSVWLSVLSDQVPTQSTFVMTPEMGATTLGGYLMPNSPASCAGTSDPGCQNAVQEFFSATYEVVDKP